MEVDTIWGTVKTRHIATRLTRIHYILLKDNEFLKPLFEWLRNTSISNMEDFESPILKEALNKIAYETEVKWSHQPRNIPMLTFQNSAPLEGDFQQAIKEYLNLLHYVMYSPERFLEFKP
jgi:hypothetical protein